jgi:hypothetical protein
MSLAFLGDRVFAAYQQYLGESYLIQLSGEGRTDRHVEILSDGLDRTRADQVHIAPMGDELAIRFIYVGQSSTTAYSGSYDPMDRSAVTLTFTGLEFRAVSLSVAWSSDGTKAIEIHTDADGIVRINRDAAARIFPSGRLAPGHSPVAIDRRVGQFNAVAKARGDEGLPGVDIVFVSMDEDEDGDVVRPVCPSWAQ